MGGKPNGALLSEKERFVEMDEGDAEMGLFTSKRARMSKQNSMGEESHPQHPQHPQLR